MNPDVNDPPPTLSGNGVFFRCLTTSEAAGAGGKEPALITVTAFKKNISPGEEMVELFIF